MNKEKRKDNSNLKVWGWVIYVIITFYLMSQNEALGYLMFMGGIIGIVFYLIGNAIERLWKKELKKEIVQTLKELKISK